MHIEDFTMFRFAIAVLTILSWCNDVHFKFRQTSLSGNDAAIKLHKLQTATHAELNIAFTLNFCERNNSKDVLSIF